MKISCLRVLLGFLSLAPLGAEEPIPYTTISIPMRDEYELPTDLYTPPDQKPEECPCILVRSPAGRHHPFYAQLAQLGYVVAIQETRNSLDSEGKVLPFYFDGSGEQQDGYDSVEWLAKSPWSNGKIGTAGASALGMTQYLLAPTNPPHLCCQYIAIATPSVYHHALFPQGQLLKHSAEGWLRLYAHDQGVVSFVKSQFFYNPFWENFNALERAKQIRTPAVHYGGWYDIFLMGTIQAFVAAQQANENNGHKMVIGPWTHHFYTSNQLGDFVVPEEGKQPPVDLSMPRWFGYYLKEEENGLQKEPNVIYYVMGPFDGAPSSGNVWRTADTWPIPSTEQSLFLTEQGMLEEAPEEKRSTKEFVHDPANPVPTIGGANLFLEAGPKDQRPIEGRDDVLLFTTAPLEKDLEVTGHLRTTLYFTTDQKDTDLVVRLCDVYPDGRSILLTDAAYRLDVMHHPYREKSQNGTIPLAFAVDLGATSFVFAKGHCIRLSISGSNYPRYEKNPNVGLEESHTQEDRIANNTVFLGGETPSHLSLPVSSAAEEMTTTTLAA